MKRMQSLVLLVVLLSVIASAQDQLENAGFEQWEDILASETDTIREPLDWSSLKTSDNPSLNPLAPVVCKRSSDAHSGEYSLELTNVQSFGNIVANGVATNGRMHPDLNITASYTYTDTLDNQWNTPLTARPDSIVGWFKFAPQGEDTLQVKVNLHQGFGKQPDAEYMENWIAVAEYRSSINTENEWGRFSVPFTYFSDADPEYVLVVLNSGAGYQAVAGSVTLFDDLELVYNSPQSTLNRQKQPDGLIFALDKQHLMIKGMDHTLFHTIKILDISGKQVWTGNVTADQVDISSAHMEQGIYLITLSGESEIYSQKIMLR